MYTHKLHTGSAHQIDNLLFQLHHVLDVHRGELGEQELEHELAWLTEWIEHFRGNESQFKEQIDEHAFSMLNAIYVKLALATSEEQRMQAESPLNSTLSEQHVAALSDTRKDIRKLLNTFAKGADLAKQSA